MDTKNDNNLLAVFILKCEPLGFPEIVRAVEAEDEENAYAWALQFVRDRQPDGVIGKFTFADGTSIEGEEQARQRLKEEGSFEFIARGQDYGAAYREEIQTTITVQIKDIERY